MKFKSLANRIFIFLLIIIVCVSCKKKYPNTVIPTTLVIGDAYQGGRIAYILQPGDIGYDANMQHGIIAASNDQSTGAEWGYYGSLITGADGEAIGTGPQNTLDITNGCLTPGIAARICGDLVLFGYSDWYLPSKDELHKLFLNQVAIGFTPAGVWYWSSTEFDANIAVAETFTQSLKAKNLTAHVRAVRAF